MIFCEIIMIYNIFTIHTRVNHHRSGEYIHHTSCFKICYKICKILPHFAHPVDKGKYLCGTGSTLTDEAHQHPLLLLTGMPGHD
jgi:hypothetical protein